MTLRFLLDEDMNPQIAEALRARGVDAGSVHEVGRSNQRIHDADQLGYAADQGRVVVTYNRADFQALDSLWRQTGRRHSGILWCNDRTLPRYAIGAAISALQAAAREYASLDGLCLPLQRAPDERSRGHPQ